MSDILYMADSVVTGDDLQRAHQGQGEVRFAPKTVITPTAWDYIREKDLRVSRGEAPDRAAPPAGDDPQVPAVQEPASGPDGASEESPRIKEVPPPQMTQEGRCDYPDRPYGCKTDEFGSGFVDDGRNDPPVLERDEVEALIQRITDLVMEQLATLPEN